MCRWMHIFIRTCLDKCTHRLDHGCVGGLQQLKQLGLDYFYSVSSQFTYLRSVPDQVNLYSGKRTTRKTKKKRSFVLFCFFVCLLRVAESLTTSARSRTSESASILLAQLVQSCNGDIFKWWVLLACFSGMRRCIYQMHIFVGACLDLCTDT